MLRASLCIAALVFVGLTAFPMAAQAQYKNAAFGFDAGYIMISKPSLADASGALLQDSSVPDRLAGGWRLGAEADFKLHDDHWWFTGRVNLGFLNFGAPATQPTGATTAANYGPTFDYDANAALGTILTTEVYPAIRYTILTDSIRPYIQVGFSYQHLFSFTSISGNTCTVIGFCDGTLDYGDAYLPHTNIFAVHVEPGLEVIVARDIALHFLADVNRWLIFNAAGNNAVTFGFGLTLFG